MNKTNHNLTKGKQMTEKEMIEIMRNGTITKCNKSQVKQIMNFAFGNEFMESKDKGKKKNYKESRG
tara:strand:+ start:280 stop:477 length:198 start_codon:yes stop_codon:yes gene_type:complete